MSPPLVQEDDMHFGFPRVSGDEPDLPRAQFVEEKFSPRERG